MNSKQHQYVISIMSRDRVGIVHEVSQAISDLEGNIAEIRQSVLWRGDLHDYAGIFSSLHHSADMKPATEGQRTANSH